MADQDGNNKALRVRTFGGFSVSWEGKMIIEGPASETSQFACVMQALLHYYKTGVERNWLEEVLFEDRDISDVHHAMQSVLYNSKKKLRLAGLPPVNYVLLRKKVFYWTEEIPVEEDAEYFEQLCARAEEEEDPAKRLDLYLEACYLYKGEFLPLQAGTPWVAQEARRYREMFCDCVEKAVVLLRDAEDYAGMEDLGVHASNIQPLSDWETVTMEALVAQARYEDARKLYDTTVDFYFQKQGLRPVKQFQELYEKLGTSMRHPYSQLDEIKSDLTGTEGDREGTGGYLCSYPIFQGIYRIVERMMERGGQSVYLMLCTIVDSKGNPMREGPSLEEYSRRLEKAIISSVRHSDTVNCYGKGQYLVLLINTTLENCKIVQKRINDQFIVGYQRIRVQYYVSNVVCTPK